MGATGIAALAALAACAPQGEPTRQTQPTEGTNPEMTPSPQPTTSAKTLLVYFSRPGENYWEGGRRDLDVGNTKRLAQMVAELAANAAILAMLNIVAPGSGAVMSGGLGGLSGLVLGRATGGPLPGSGAVVYNERREEAIIQRGGSQWMVFPWLRKDGTVAGDVDRATHSGTFGWAIRYEGP